MPSTGRTNIWRPFWNLRENNIASLQEDISIPSIARASSTDNHFPSGQPSARTVTESPYANREPSLLCQLHSKRVLDQSCVIKRMLKRFDDRFPWKNAHTAHKWRPQTRSEHCWTSLTKSRLLEDFPGLCKRWWFNTFHLGNGQTQLFIVCLSDM